MRMQRVDRKAICNRIHQPRDRSRSGGEKLAIVENKVQKSYHLM